jgi:zinc protease
MNSLPGSDNITRVNLANGIVVLVRENHNKPTLSINGYLTVGGLFDPDEKLGLANFTASALLRGAAGRSFQEIYDTLESVGASLLFSSGYHTTVFSSQSLAEDLGLVIGLLADAICQPDFPDQQVERLRAQLLASLALRAQDTGQMAQLAFEQLVYAGHPYSRPEDGKPETVQAITPHDLGEFHRKHYGPTGLVIAIVGAVRAAQAVEMVNKALGGWENPTQPELKRLPAVTSLKEITRKYVQIAGKFQADLVMGAAGPPRSSPDFIAANLGNSILGQFGMMGRIGEIVREQYGLAYYCSSNLSGGLGPGPWDISAGIDPQNIEQTIELIRHEVRRFVSEPVDPDELQDVQTYYTGSLPLSLESNQGMAAALVNLERHQLGLDYYRQYSDMIRSVSREDILAAGRAYLDPDRLGIGIAGPSARPGDGQ